MKNQVSFRIFLVLWNKIQNQTTPAVHLKIATWLEARWKKGDKRLLLMAFRSCGKSTLVGLFAAWLLYRRPDLRILVLAADLALARKMVRNVKRIIERHPLTAPLKPPRADQWGSDRFTIRRPKELRDPSMLAKGISANLTGSRADIIICDDVEVPNTCDTVEKREMMRGRLAELDFILVPGGSQLYVGTPHSWYTIYADTPRKEIGEETEYLKGFRRLTVPILDTNQESVWPERFPHDEIDRMRIKAGPNLFSSQMMLQPVNITDGKLDPSSLLIYEGDLSYSEAQRETVLGLEDRKLISASAWWDPAFGRKDGDRSVVAIVYTDEAGDYWLHRLEIITVSEQSEDDEATQQCRVVADLAKTYYLPTIALETNGLGKFLPGILRRELGGAGIACSVREISSRKPKSFRILEAFDAVLAAKALHVHRSVMNTPFLREMQEWRPGKSSSHDDTLDAVAGALSLEPVRLRRAYGGAKQKWMGSSTSSKAKTHFEV